MLLNCLVFLLDNNVLFLLSFLKAGPGHGFKEEKLSSSAAQKITKLNWELSLQAETSRHQQVSNKCVHRKLLSFELPITLARRCCTKEV